MFKAILTALVYGYTIIIMLGMGASIDIDVPAEIRKSPKAILGRHAWQVLLPRATSPQRPPLPSVA